MSPKATNPAPMSSRSAVRCGRLLRRTPPPRTRVRANPYLTSSAVSSHYNYASFFSGHNGFRRFAAARVAAGPGKPATRPDAPRGYGAWVSLTVGMRGRARIEVAAADTAIAAGSGDVPVLATPRLLALAEAAAVAAAAPGLAPGETSVGTSADLRHIRATPVGAAVEVVAELTELDGRRLVFRFTATQPGEQAGAGVVVGEGTMERSLVDRERFLRRAASR